MNNGNTVTPCGQAEYPASVAAYTTHTETSGWAAGPQAVWVFCTTAAYVEVGSGAVATTASLPMPANVPMLIKVPPQAKDGWVVSAVQVAAGGNCYAKPCNW